MILFKLLLGFFAVIFWIMAAYYQLSANEEIKDKYGLGLLSFIDRTVAKRYFKETPTAKRQHDKSQVFGLLFIVAVLVASLT